MKHDVGWWLSAALDDPDACEEFKEAVREWFDLGSPPPSALVEGGEKPVGYLNERSGVFVSTAYFSGLCEASRSKYAPLYATPPSRNDTIRECAAKAKTWLEDWGIDLQATCDAYIDAANNGLFNGRRIDPVLAKASAKQFKERADSVYDCGEQLSKVLRALLTDEVKP